ncbi:Flavin-containing monooxygenase FMO GS-OX1 [Orchesella cincta]|uniref:Flavin-containing monooxygenase n=1 Tax=Orchesella cincta TaxID=48709 RepID=A0A1D2N404_ORCCI|nr:Flavin-containing monooxygenase FMO GS-OX1 [Orchesella cincta]
MFLKEGFKHHCEQFKAAHINPPSKKKVVIVGGGASGLVSLRRVLDSSNLIGTLIEQKDDVGGIWYYNGEKQFAASSRNNMESLEGQNNPENTTTMYDNLSSNLPYVLMEFLDFKHTHFAYTFATQQQVHHYLRDYATHFNLWPNIQLNTSVVDIRPEYENLPDGKPGKWIVETHNLLSETFHTEIYDAVLICTGKHSYPYQRPIPGLDTFKGRVIHSKYFKNADEFADQSVVCIGLGPSSADLALALSKTAKKVTVCHKFSRGARLGLVPPNVREANPVEFVGNDGVVTKANQTIACDAIIFCTGYGVKFPYLNPSCGVTIIEERYVPHLYNKTIFTKRPTLCFLNMCYRSPEFICMEIQARYIVSYLEGSTKLPSFTEMEVAVKAEEEEKEQQGIPRSVWLQVGDSGAAVTWEYFWRIAEEIGTKKEFKNGPILEQIYTISFGRVFGSLALYKNDKLRIVNENTWEYTLASKPEYPESKQEIITLIANPDFTASVERKEIDE